MMKRKFPPGSEWLYLKIYTGVKTSDLILEEVIQPLVEYFQENNYISKWFFIRYNDPKLHIRLRLRLNNTEYYREIIDKINIGFQQYVYIGEISTIQIDTYNREIERYGENTIEDAEILFYQNSEFTLLCLPYDDEDKIIFSIFYINEILDKLSLEVWEKLSWIQNFNGSFKEEFNADKNLNSQLDKKYRKFKPQLIKFMQSDEFLDERSAIVSHVEECDSTLQNILQQHQNQLLEMSLQSFFQSIFHMNINRLFVSNQRLFEMVIYDYLLRYYKSAMFHELH